MPVIPLFCWGSVQCALFVITVIIFASLACFYKTYLDRYSSSSGYRVPVPVDMFSSSLVGMPAGITGYPVGTVCRKVCVQRAAWGSFQSF